MPVITESNNLGDLLKYEAPNRYSREVATFMFSVKGDSMINAGIQEGDKVIVDRALNARHDDIVVAVVAGDYTIKRLYKHMGRVELRPENLAYPPIVFQEGAELLVWGVVVGVVRRYPVHGYLWRCS